MHVRESIWERTSEYSGFSSEPEDGVSSESAKEKRKKLEHVKNCRGKTKRDPVEKNQLGNQKIARSHEETERKEKRRERHVTLWRFLAIVIMRRFFYFFVFFLLVIVFFFFSFPIFFFFLLFLLFMVVILVVLLRLVLMLLLLLLRMSRMEEVVVRGVPFVEGVG